MDRIASLERQATAKAGLLAAIFGATASGAKATHDGNGNGGLAFTLTKGDKSLDVSITSNTVNGTECIVSDDARGGEIHWSDSPKALNKFLAEEFA